MNCSNISGILSGFNLETMKASDLLEELDANTLTRKMIQLLDKQVIVNSWAYAGKGCFDKDGHRLDTKKKGCFNYKIEYKDLSDFNEHFYLIDEIF